MLFLVRESGWHPEGASAHTEWVLQRPFQNVAEWLGEEGDKYRARCFMTPVPPPVKEGWIAFQRQQADRTVADLTTELSESARQAGPMSWNATPPRRSTKRRKAA